MSGIRVRPIALGLLTTLLFFGCVELTARVYNAIRSRSLVSLTYGHEFFLHLLQGKDVQTEQSLYRDPADQARFAERAFRNRNGDSAPDFVDGKSSVVLSYGIPSRRNRYGYRGEDFILNTPPGFVRIVTLGGSFVFGGGLLDDETWPQLLQERLNHQGARAQVVNLGISGANIHDVVVTLIKATRRMAMDYALVVSAYNNHPLLRVERRFTFARKLDFWLYNISIFHVLATEKLSRLQGQPLDYGLYRRKVHVDRADLQRWADMYRQRLEQLEAICRERRIRLVLMAQPYVFYDRAIAARDTVDERQVADMEANILGQQDVWEMELAFYLQGKQNVAMKTFAKEHDVEFFDGVDVFPADLQPLFWDTIHPKAAGSALLANALSKYFAGIDERLRALGTERRRDVRLESRTPALAASLARSQDVGIVGVPVRFDGSASSGASMYAFDYGDGTAENAPSPSQTHVYRGRGNTRSASP